MDDSLRFCNHLAEARKSKGLSQSQLAELVGVSRQTISSIETGQFNPTARLALLLCIALDQKFEDLFHFGEQWREAECISSSAFLQQ
ncbi:MAG: helix-turn-helix transcriptional regulator [Bulleidia sp.]|nr:helix-turn-helix transcriptional regulator [Bulleidia sp.]